MALYHTGAWAALFLAGTAAVARPSRAEIATVGYRESAESFTWELEWDGAVPSGSQELTPPRADTQAPEHWSALVRIAPNPKSRSTVRFAFEARHGCRVHETDAPEGATYRAVFFLDHPLRGSSDWVRLDGKLLPHLATPKDRADAFDVLYRVAAKPEGKNGRLVFQAAHGPGLRAKKAAKPGAKSPRPPDRIRQPISEERSGRP